MGYVVNPPSFNEVTGEYEGDFQVENREMQRGINQVSIEDIDPNEYNDALEPYYAQRAIQANLPIFDENASDADVVAFWRNPNPLTEAEVDAIQAAYVATDNHEIANLLQWKLTGDESFLSEQQRYELGLDDEASIDEIEATDDDLSEWREDELLTEDDVIAFENFLAENATDPDPGVAQSILNADIGDSDEARTIQYVAHQYYTGNLTLEDAYAEALSTGLSEAKLYAAFNTLYQQMNDA
jgi:hypothetical protein